MVLVVVLHELGCLEAQNKAYRRTRLLPPSSKEPIVVIVEGLQRSRDDSTPLFCPCQFVDWRLQLKSLPLPEHHVIDLRAESDRTVKVDHLRV